MYRVREHARGAVHRRVARVRSMMLQTYALGGDSAKVLAAVCARFGAGASVRPLRLSRHVHLVRSPLCIWIRDEILCAYLLVPCAEGRGTG